MKKYIVFSILLFLLYFEALCQTGCQNEVIPSQGFHFKQAQYFCHQYVKAALIGDFIDMTDGKPKPTANESQFATLYPNATIAGDPDFIRVCSVSDAKAVCPSPGGDTGVHSAIILNNGIFASTPNASSNWIYYHQGPRAFTRLVLEKNSILHQYPAFKYLVILEPIRG